MKVFRISNNKYKTLEGLGGLFAWGRWHNKGVRVIYASENRSLAAWERMVHIGNLNLLPNDLIIMEIEIPENNIVEVPKKIMVEGWRSYPYSKETTNYGTYFLKNNLGLALKVPSVIIQAESNFIINPNHNDISKCKIIDIKPFTFDKRVISLTNNKF